MVRNRPAGDEPRAMRAALVTSLLALALRLAYLAAGPPQQAPLPGWTPPHAAVEQQTPGLSRKYQAVAAGLLRGDGFSLQRAGSPVVPYVDRLPGYVIVLAGVIAAAGTSSLALSVAHAIFGAAQAGLAAVAGARVRGVAGAWLAGGLVACWPPLWKSDLQIVETGLSGALVTAMAALALGAGPRSPRGRAVAWALLSLGAVLLRPDYLLLPVLAAAWQLAESGRRALPAAALTLALPAIACAAWAARNARVADGAFVSVGLGTNLLAAVGESVATDQPAFGDKDVAVAEGHQGLYWPDPARRDRERLRRAIELVREHPGGYAKGCVRRVAVTLSMHPGRLWPGPTAEDDVRAWRAAHPGRARYEGLFAAVASHVRAHPLLAAATFAWAPVALLLGALGAARLLAGREGRSLVALASLPAYGLLVHVPLHAEPRYFMPFLPCVLVLACCARRARPLRDETRVEA